MDNKKLGFFFVYHKEWYNPFLKKNSIVRFKFIFFFIAMFVLILTLFSKDLFFICFLFEIVTVCFVFLFFHNGFKSKEAIVKFYIYSALNEFLFFFGVAFVYLAYGTFNIELLFVHSGIMYNHLFLIGLFFIIFSFIFKIGIFPFHF
jgi:NADH:ubiquinone oxidoreductase subunit 2 (subunit N)